jgi:amino acid transporter
MALIALVNLRGVGESVKANVVLTGVELTGLLIVIAVEAWALAHGDGDTSRLNDFSTPGASRRSVRSRRPPHWRSSRWSASRIQ